MYEHLGEVLPAAVVAAITGVLCAGRVWRAWRRPAARLGWAALALAHLGRAATLGWFVVHGASSAAEVAPRRLDVVDLAYYPLTLLGLWVLLRDRAPRWRASTRWDGAVVALGALATGATLTPLIGPLSARTSERRSLQDVAGIAFLVLYCAIAIWVVSLYNVGRPGADRRRRATSVISAKSPSAGSSPARRPALPATSALPALAAGLAGAVLALVVLGGPAPTAAGLLALACLLTALLRVALTLRGLALPTRQVEATRTDELTGLANRRALSEALAADGEAPGAEGNLADGWWGWTDRIALLLVDIDHFQQVNEALGHDSGDRVLAEVAGRLAAVLRPPQLLARLGGDEFAVVLPGAGPQPAVRVAEALRDALGEPIEVAGQRLHVRASVGVATCRLPREDPRDLLRQADVAVHRAKANSGGVQVYDAGRDGPDAGRLKRVDELRSALARGDLEVYLQPQVDLATGELVGVEALARWRHPQDGVLLPASFLPLAAQTGLMQPVAVLVLERGLAACAQWWASGRQVPVSINLTADDLRDAALTTRIFDSLARFQLPPQALCIELTEEALLVDLDAAASLLSQWRSRGVAVAIDDFGTGYSSLAYLRALPVDELKLDRAFVSDLRRRTTATIVRHSVAMAHGLGMRVVGEGVEDEATARALAGAGCDVGQGNYFGAAMPLEALLVHLRDGSSFAQS